MNKENLKSKKIEVNTFNKYKSLVRDISESFMPIPTIFQFFVLNKEKMKDFLTHYYKIYFELRDIFDLIYESDENFNKDKKDILFYINKNNYRENISEFKSSNLFNINKLRGLRDLLLDKICFIDIQDHRNKVELNIKKISEDIENLSNSSLSILEFSDSSLSQDENYNFNLKLNKEDGFHHWEAFENIIIDFSKTENNKEFFKKNAEETIYHKYYNFFYDDNDKKIDKLNSETNAKFKNLKDELDNLKEEIYNYKSKSIKNIKLQQKIKNTTIQNFERTFTPNDYIFNRFVIWNEIQSKRVDNKCFIDPNYMDVSNILEQTNNNIFYIETEKNYNDVISNIFDGIFRINEKVIDLFNDKFEDLKPFIFSGVSFANESFFEKYIDLYYPDLMHYSNIKSLYNNIKKNKYFNIDYDLQMFLPFSDNNRVYLYYIFYNSEFFAGYDYYKLDFIKELYKKIVELNSILKLNSKYIQNNNTNSHFFNLKSKLDNHYSLLKNISSNLEKKYSKIKEEKNYKSLGIFKSFFLIYTKDINNKSYFIDINSEKIIYSDIFEKVIYSKNFCLFFEDGEFSDRNIKETEGKYIEKIFLDLFDNNNLDFIVKENLSIENYNHYIETCLDNPIGKIIFLYPIKVNHENSLGLYVSFFFREHIYDVNSEFFSPIKETINNILDNIETFSYIDVIYSIKNNFNKNSSEVDVLKMLNKTFDNTFETNYFPSIFFISDLYHTEIYNKISFFFNSNENNIIFDISEFKEENIQIEKIFDCSFINDIDINDIKAFKFNLLENFEYEKDLNQKIILVFAYKEYNNFLFDSKYTDEIINMIKKELLVQFFIKRKNIELKNMHEMMFSMLDHKINNDILAYSLKIRSVIKNIKKYSEHIDPKKYSEIISSLEFILSRNKERQKFLDAVKILLSNKANFSGLEDVNIKDYLNNEIDNAIKVKVSSETEDNITDWEKLIVSRNSNLGNIILFREVKEFIGFIFFELLSNAVKYKDNSIENTVEFDITKIKREEHNFLKISVSNVLKEENKKTLNLKEIFNKGKRFGDSKTTSGTGLGLYIIRYITENTFHGRVNAKIDKDRIVISVELDFEKLG